MKIITISREFGSGGRELGKRLADRLGFDYYDREIITAIAQAQGMDAGFVEKTLENHGWRSMPMTFRHSFAAPSVMQTAQTRLLLEEKRVVEGIAALGKDCVIVGRNADVLLAKEKPFSLFVCADIEARIQRCIERAAEDEKLGRREIERNIRQIDKNRARTREIIAGGGWGQAESYHLTVNTTDWSIRDLTPAVADFAQSFFGRKQ